MNISEKHPVIATHVLTGLAQGIIFWISYRYWGGAEGPSSPLAALSSFVAVSGLILQFGWTRKDRIRAYLIAALTGLAYAAIAWWVFSELPAKGVSFRGDTARVASFIFASICSLYILIPYVQVYHEGGSFKFPYTELFRHSWNNFFIAAIACIFTGLFWGLISLWGGLFKLIGVGLFADIFFTAPFSFITTPVAFGLGLMLGKELHTVTISLRNIALLVFKTLMPLLSFIALLFIFALPFTGLTPLWDTKRSSVVTLTLLAFTILFINAVFQDGKTEPPYPVWIRRGVEGMLLAMPAYGAITLYSIWLRVAQYGFTPERVYALVFAIVAGLYSIGYAVSVFVRKGEWLGFMRAVNIAVSLIVVAVALLLHTPLLDPISISAESQFKRLVSGRADPLLFEYEVLKFSLGSKGFEKLKALSELKEHPDAGIIRERAKKTIEQERYAYSPEQERYAYSPGRERKPMGKTPDTGLKEEYLEVLTASGKLPDGLLDAIKTGVRTCGDTLAVCARKKDCAVFPMNMDGDNEDEYLFVPSGVFCEGLYLFDKDDAGNWSYIGKMELVSSANKDRDMLIEAIKGSTLAPSVPKYRDIESTDKERHWLFKLKN